MVNVVNDWSSIAMKYHLYGSGRAIRGSVVDREMSMLFRKLALGCRKNKDGL